MITRRSAMTMSAAGDAGGLAAPANAAEFQPYDAAEVQKAIASGKPVVVHVYAPGASSAISRPPTSTA